MDVSMCYETRNCILCLNCTCQDIFINGNSLAKNDINGWLESASLS